MNDTVTNRLAKATERSHDEIIERLDDLKALDYFGFQSSDLLVYLPWDKAKPFLRETANEGDWRAAYPIFTPPLGEIEKYLPFAWDKANNCRGLSAMRSLEHIKAWLWLAGYSLALLEHFEDYDYYGKPQLVLASHLVGFNWRDVDNGKWVTGEHAEPISDAGVHNLITKMTALGDLYMRE